MAFALALQSVHDLPEGHGQTIFTATTAIIVLTVSNIKNQLIFMVDLLWNVHLLVHSYSNLHKIEC